MLLFVCWLVALLARVVFVFLVAAFLVAPFLVFGRGFLVGSSYWDNVSTKMLCPKEMESKGASLNISLTCKLDYASCRIFLGFALKSLFNMLLFLCIVLNKSSMPNVDQDLFASLKQRQFDSRAGSYFEQRGQTLFGVRNTV